MGQPHSTARARLRSPVAIAAIIAMLMVGPGSAAAPTVETTTPEPVTTVSREALDNLPQSGDLKAVLEYHNRVRTEVGSPPLKWNPGLAANADAYARILADTGQPQHASRVGRATERENISLSPHGTNSPLALVGRWGNERRFFRGGIFPDACTTDWSQCAHFTQMVWSGTTDIGCAFHQGRQFDALVCRYSPPGNQDGRPVIGVPPTRIAQGPININNPPTPPMQQDAPGANEEQPGEAEDDGGANEEAGGTTVRPTPGSPLAPPNEGLSRITGKCGASVIARVRIIEVKDPDDEDKPRRTKESHNLGHGFTEIVIPYGWDADVDWAADPDPQKTFPAPGTMTANWTVVGQAARRDAHTTGDYPHLQMRLQSALRGGKGWDEDKGVFNINPPNRPTTQRHRIEAVWDPVPPTAPDDSCPTDHDFTVTFADRVPPAPGLNLATFVGEAQQNGFGGTRARQPVGDGTRLFSGTGPRSRTSERRDREGNVVTENGKVLTVENVLFPIGIYWDGQENCCNIKGAERKVVQFARAAIHGPNGRMGKEWTLDILPSEVRNAPNHDPTYTGHPKSDQNEPVEAEGSGGTASIGNDLLQWDAPGMPKDLFDRLYGAQGPSTYRQQFLSLLLCRRGTGHRTGFYLGKDSKKRERGLICQIAITTVRWEFPGQLRVPPQGRQRGEPTIHVSFDVRDGNCIPLRSFLEANGLRDEFERPDSTSRGLDILKQEPYQQLDDSVTNWESNPFAGVRFP